MITDAVPWLEQILAAIEEAQSGQTPEDLATAPTLEPLAPDPDPQSRAAAVGSCQRPPDPGGAMNHHRAPDRA